MFLFPSTVYCARFKIVHTNDGLCTDWSATVEFASPRFEDFCAWKGFPCHLDEEFRYSLDEENPRVVTKADESMYPCTAIGNALLPLNNVMSWSIMVVKTKWDDGSGIFIGIAPHSINKKKGDNYSECGWYISCYWSELVSGHLIHYSLSCMGLRGNMVNTPIMVVSSVLSWTP